MPTRPRHVLLGVSGSIAAYKAAPLVRLLVGTGAEVRVVMTPAATGFITPLTLATLSRNPALSTYTRGEAGEWNNHVELGLWADAMVVAPLSARTLAKFAHGLADDLLTACYLSARCPVFVAPAMDLDMYAHPTTVENLARLRRFGNHVIDAGVGKLASGLSGQGRMAEPEQIVATLQDHFGAAEQLSGKRVLVTAGPTHEPIDPVRFLGNHSSGKMGWALAEALRDAGADVTLVSGPTALPDPAGVRTVRVTTAEQMHTAALQHFEGADWAVLAAAVADYTPREVSAQKIKKEADEVPRLELRRTPDIAAELGRRKRADQTLIGFALETNDAVENARAKLRRKRLDWIVLNTLEDAGAGFQHDTNKVRLLSADGGEEAFALMPKTELARRLVARWAAPPTGTQTPAADVIEA
ncbi:MAG: bifunctional phosphopantothenoylcysteine decarboxylase/phosphopantothenate--cysteine ligase CoaBC [Catalinimonas sp.]